MKRIIAALLSVVMLCGSFTFLMPVSAAEESTEEFANPAFLDYSSATTEAIERRAYNSAQEYLDSFMQLRVTSGAFQLYTNHFTGEVALKNRLTGQILSTNPFAFGKMVASEDSAESTTNWWAGEEIREQLLSQVLISYKDQTGAMKTMDSFSEAAQRGQIVMQDIKNGVRVEYVIGRLDTTYLLPMWIMDDRFEEEIVMPICERLDELLMSYGETELYDEESGETREEFYDRAIEKYNKDKTFQNTYFAYKQMLASYVLNDPNGNYSTSFITSMQENYPITAEKDSEGNYHAIYVLADSLSGNQKTNLEGYVKAYCSDYGYDDLEADHAATGYVATEEELPVFRLTLEYVIDENGMSVCMPASELRYDESLVTLDNISLVPFFGAGNMMNDGYAFYPDGSGSILEFKDLYNDYEKISDAPSGKVYGEDFAYYTITGQHQESIRMPVYGIIETENVVRKVIDEATGEEKSVSGKESKGFLAIISEGDALTEISAEFGASEHPFASIYSVVTPRPTDDYDLKNAISATGSSDQKWTVVSDKKYTGNYKTQIVMLTDRKVGDALIVDPTNDIDSYYSADWIGMAGAYRDYLEENGLITALTDEDVEDQLPLYIETFGTIETTEKFLSMPITVDVALTTFNEVTKMYADLKGQGIENVNFRLVGFANGGMDYRYPVKLKWEKEAGGKSGFKKLLADAEKNGYGVYPDFDFLYIENDKFFDGVSKREMAVRTVDDRYASKQIYDAVYQDFSSYFSICVASSQMSSNFKAFNKKYDDYSAKGLSLALFATDLNSNFDEDDPTTREEAKAHYIEFLKAASEKYSLMSDGGNIYTVPYIDHMLNMPIESSNFNYASYSVPFLGMVLHGYLNYAGSPFNEAGDVAYNIMRSIENGMAAYYVLSYNSENTALLKQDTTLSQNYSIRYDIWFGSNDDNGKFVPGELLSQYKLLNAAIGDLQTARITNHRLLRYERVRTQDEIVKDEKLLIENIEKAIASAAETAESAQILIFRRELDMFNKLQETEESSSFNRGDLLKYLKEELTETLSSYMKDTLYVRESVYNAEETSAKASAFAKAFFEGKTADDFEIDLVMAEAVCTQQDADGALITTYRDLYYALPADQRPGEYPDMTAALRAEADRYNVRVCASLVDAYIAGEFTENTGKTVAIVFDKAAIVESIKETINAEALTEEQLATVDKAIAASTKLGDVTVTISDLDMAYTSSITESLATEGSDTYQATPYSLYDSRCVMLTYTKEGNDKDFILNYNLFGVEVRYTNASAFTVTTFADNGEKTTKEYSANDIVTIKIPSNEFVRIDVKGGN
ncbi:MAG: hypothetical protein IKC63_02070 [Clostridia bacterium]|nr:hypothetical protein [Clostridia bacterium]